MNKTRKLTRSLLLGYYSRETPHSEVIAVAAAGEKLSLFATGLGPTNASLNPGQPFPSAPLAVVNGESAVVLAAVGYPGSVNAYQVNFRVPPDAAKGTASVQVTAAWIPGALVNIANSMTLSQCPGNSRERAKQALVGLRLPRMP